MNEENQETKSLLGVLLENRNGYLPNTTMGITGTPNWQAKFSENTGVPINFKISLTYHFIPV
jgi:hypothetical protein